MRIELDTNRVVLIFVIDFLIQLFFVVVDDKVLDQLMKMLILNKIENLIFIIYFIYLKVEQMKSMNLSFELKIIRYYLLLYLNNELYFAK